MRVRARKRARAHLVLFTLVLLAPACAGGTENDAELVLISRDAVTGTGASGREELFGAERCRLDGDIFTCLQPGQQIRYRDADGRRAVLTSAEWEFSLTRGDETSVNCGDRTFSRVFVSRSVPDVPLPAWILRFDDGSAVSLQMEEWLVVNDLRAGGPSCYEVRGIWEGTEGDLSGRSGTYLESWDTLQTTLTLTDG